MNDFMDGGQFSTTDLLLYTDGWFSEQVFGRVLETRLSIAKEILFTFSLGNLC